MKSIRLGLFVLLVFVQTGCETYTKSATTPLLPTQIQTSVQDDGSVKDSVTADVVTVKVKGESGKYQFAVEISSPDTGCDQYADWWEVLSEDGQVLYRRVLLHSHVDEQPFIRSGGPVPIDEDTIVLVRAHLNTVGYGGRTLKGNVVSGFESINLDAGFAANVESLPPLPEDCAF